MDDNHKSKSTGSTSHKLSATVAIPCYNASQYLPCLLDSLSQQTRPADEILVIDDGSVDSTRQIAESHGIKLLQHKKNLGLASARNTAVREAKSDIIVYFDADTKAQNTTLEWILREYADPEIAGVGGQEIFYRSPKNADLWRNLFWRQTHGDKKINSAWMLPGLCCSYRKIILKQIGGFDEEYKTNGEDVDIGIRITKAGYRMVYIPRAGVFHRRTDSLQSLLTMVYRHSYWQSRALRKNGIDPSFQLRTAIKWFFASTGSSIFTHHNVILTTISPIICSYAILARLKESGKYL